jgi:hemerythrin-like domain-containing protein
MCDYCDCRRIPEIAALGEEHERIEDLADLVMKAVKDSDADTETLFARLVGLLTTHVAREESGLFIEARTAGLGAEYVEDLEEDHRHFEALLKDPSTLDAAAVEALFDELHRHIAIEEYDLFPAAAQLLSADQWARIPAES